MLDVQNNRGELFPPPGFAACGTRASQAQRERGKSAKHDAGHDGLDHSGSVP